MIDETLYEHSYQVSFIPHPIYEKTLLAVLLVGCAAFASAQIFYDVNGATAGFGDYNSTTWSSVNTNWTTSSAGTAATVTWSAAGGASATSVFDTTGQSSGTKNIDVDSDFSLFGLSRLGSRAVQMSSTGAAQTLTMAGGNITVSDSNLTIGAGLTLTGDFTKEGGAALLLSVLGTVPAAASTYSGTMTINAGQVAFNHARTTSASNMVINVGGTAQLNSNGDATIGNLSGSGLLNMNNANNRSITITQTANQTFSGILGDNTTANTLSFVKAGSATLTLSGASANTFDGTMSINEGTIVAAKDGALSTTAATVGANGNLQINNGISLTASGITLAATTSQLTVGTTGATGTATIATLATTAAGANFNFDLNGTGAVDLLNITGAANFSGDSLTFDFNDLGGSSFLANTWYTIISAGTLTGPASVTAVDPAGWSGFNWQVSGNDLQIQYGTVIPEPSTWALLAGTLTTLVVFRRRKA